MLHLASTIEIIYIIYEVHCKMK